MADIIEFPQRKQQRLRYVMILRHFSELVLYMEKNRKQIDEVYQKNSRKLFNNLVKVERNSKGILAEFDRFGDFNGEYEEYFQKLERFTVETSAVKSLLREGDIHGGI